VAGKTATLDITTNHLTMAGATGAASTGALTKAGAGTLTLTGTSTYSGITTISGGSLALGAGDSINNSGGVALDNGHFNVSAIPAGYAVAALTGNGSVTGDLTVTRLVPGSSPGTITFDNTLTLTSIADFEINGLGAGEYDLATGGGGSQQVNFGGTLNLLFAPGFNTTGTVKIFDFETYSGNFTTVNPTGLASGYEASFDQTSGLVTVIPEPGAGLLGSLGLLALLRRRR
jgi:autotransporter-associated beta strand protein